MAKASLGIAGSDCGCGCGGSKQGIGEPISVTVGLAAKKIGAYCKGQPQQCAKVGAQISQFTSQGIQNALNAIKGWFQGGSGCDRAGIFNRAHADRKFVQIIDGAACIVTMQPLSALMYYRMTYPLCNVSGRGNWYLIWPDKNNGEKGKYWQIYWAEGDHANGYFNEEVRAKDRITDHAAVSEMHWTGSLDAPVKDRRGETPAMASGAHALQVLGLAEVSSLADTELARQAERLPPPQLNTVKPAPAPATPPSPVAPPAPPRPAAPPAPAVPPQQQQIPQPIKREMEKADTNTNILLLGGLAAAALIVLRK
jgi:hypothetical protein